MDRIILNEPTCGEAIARLVGMHYIPGSCSTICRVKDGVLYGGAVYYNRTPVSVCAHVGAWEDNWLTRDLLWMMFDYPFNQLGVKRIFGQVSEDNEHALKFDQKLGFRPVARIEGMYANDAACIVLRLDREDCRFLDLKPRHYGRSVH